MNGSDSSLDSDVTESLFPEASGRSGTYQVLARKYRPQCFEDLIGQEAMVRTLSNAFQTGRIAHGFMLTGVRGVGKTTTARLLARALNYQPAGDDGSQGTTGRNSSNPSVKLDPPGLHCEAIMASRHPDVLELDAASRTGVAEMRDLLDSARYGPVSARFKVYIIDEVHMLSNASFNALLKTLEEPPPHLKFIFATTEIRKVPVTVLSRCQRFDLKRLDTSLLANHLGRVSARENASVSQEALSLIARAAEGSVRDALSLLDQAIIQTTDGSEVTGAAVREMLGLGDRSRLLDIFDLALQGDARGALGVIDELLSCSADPATVLKDMLDISADISIAQAAGGEWVPAGPADWASHTLALAQKISPAMAARLWQLLLSGYNDLSLAPDPVTALRMVVLRLTAACSLPSPEEAVRIITQGLPPPGKQKAPLEAPPDVPGGIRDFSAMLAAMNDRREVGLLVDTERFVRIADFRPGRLVCSLAPQAPAGLLSRIRGFLEASTSEEWVVEETETNAESVRERERREQSERIALAREHPFVAATLAALPGSIILDVMMPGQLENTSDADNLGSNVISMKTRRPA